MPSICNRFLSCKVWHTKIDNLKSQAVFGESALNARFFCIVFLLVSYLYYTDFKLVCKYLCEHALRSTLSKDPKKRGFSLYCGSSQSEIRFRIYDKRIEQQVFDQVESWIRFEIQLRRDRAAVFIDMLLNGGSELSTLFLGVVKNYLRFIVPTGDSNLSRCPTAQYWLDFLGSVDKVSLFFPDFDYSESRLETYVKSQLSGSCVTFISLFGFQEFVNLILSRSTLKLNPKHLFLLSKNHINNATDVLKDGIEKFKDTPYEYNWLGGSLL